MIEMYSDLMIALAVALPLFLIGVISPGPATLGIMMLSAKSGRRRGLTFALGVCGGSLFWGTAAALGLSSVLTLYAEFTLILRIAGGSYLLWLAFKSLRSAVQGRELVAQPSLVVAQGMVMVCWLCSVATFIGYAFLFSTGPVIAGYRRCARAIDGVCGALFALAGLKIFQQSSV